MGVAEDRTEALPMDGGYGDIGSLRSMSDGELAGRTLSNGLLVSGSSTGQVVTVSSAAAPVVAQGNPATPGAAPPYPAPAAVPTQLHEFGIRFDFNQGARVTLPAGQWHVRLRDDDTGNVLFETTTGNSFINSSKRYYVRFRIEVWKGDQAQGIPDFVHEYCAKDRAVLIQFPIGTLGDTIAWFPYAVKFQRQHGCKLTIGMNKLIIPLFKDAYPDIELVPHEDVRVEEYYATYSIGLFFDDSEHVWQPCDFRHVGLHKTAGYILGVDPEEEIPTVVLPDETRPIAEKYVCIAVQSSSQPKYWNNPYGWKDVIAFLKEAGYRVICIDQKSTHGTGLVWNHIPHGVEDETGDRSLTERARWLRHADLFIGTSSGLSWLAWAVGTPVVMVSGFTHPTNEFATPYRVINYHACNSCWNDIRHRFQHHDFLWCPRHAGTERQFECTKLITAEQVKGAIRKVPAFHEQLQQVKGDH